MGIKEKDKSLLEIAIELLQKKRKPQKINSIVAEVMELKGYKPTQANAEAPQFILDFMQSGNFVYCGDDCWDLKDRQPLSILDKDGGDYEEIFDDNEDVKNNELKNDDILEPFITPIDDDSDDDDTVKDDDAEEDDDLSREFASLEDKDDDEETDDDDVEGKYKVIQVVDDEEEIETEDDELTEEDFK